MTGAIELDENRRSARPSSSTMARSRAACGKGILGFEGRFFKLPKALAVRAITLDPCIGEDGAYNVRFRVTHIATRSMPGAMPPWDLLLASAHCFTTKRGGWANLEMADIFISYSKSDRVVAEALVADLKAHGFDVWWDFELYAGDDFHDMIRAEIAKAKATIVIWSDTAVASKWVRGEADEASDLGTLVSTHAAGFDARKVPINFRALHCEPVTNRERVVAAVERKGVWRAASSFSGLRESRGEWTVPEPKPDPVFKADDVLFGRVSAGDVLQRLAERLRQTKEQDVQHRPATHLRGPPASRPSLGTAPKTPPASPHPLIRTNHYRVLVGLSRQEEERWLKPNECIRDAHFAPEMVLVPPGKFWMGSRESEGGDGALPRHEITIGYPLLVSKYPITRGEFADFVQATGHEVSFADFWDPAEEWLVDTSKSWRDPGFSQSNQHPVVCVSWYDSKAYASWLSETTGKSYRLLSEAEWEYCCRAETTARFSFGETISSDEANYDGIHDCGSGRNGVYREKTTEVGTFPANAFGLHDMHGNVWEWCEDSWHEDYTGSPKDGSAWTTDGDPGRHVLRGGSWKSSSVDLLSAMRIRCHPIRCCTDHGFRLARTLAP